MNYTSLEMILKDAIRYNLDSLISLRYNGTRVLHINDYNIHIHSIKLKNTVDSTVFVTMFSAKGEIWKATFPDEKDVFEKEFSCNYWKSYDELFDNDVLRSWENLIFIKLSDFDDNTIMTLDDNM